MSSYQRIRSARRMIWTGVGLAYCLAAVILILRLLNVEPRLGEIMGSFAMSAAVGVAPTIAIISLDRRPGLLPAAAFAAVASTIVEILFLPVLLVSALLWMRASSRRSGEVMVTGAQWWTRVGMAFGVILAVLVLFVHLDPACTETMSDGTVVEVDPAERGFPKGWNFGGGAGRTSSGESTESGSTVSSWCTSNTIVPGEALVSMILSGVVIGSALRWRVNTPHRAATVPVLPPT